MKVMRYLSSIAPTLTIFGNVEYHNDYAREQSKELGKKLPFLYDDINKLRNASVINNKVRNINGVRIGGLVYFVDTSWVMEFKPSDYKDRLKDAKEQTNKAKRILKEFRNLDILVCHQPPLWGS